MKRFELDLAKPFDQLIAYCYGALLSIAPEREGDLRSAMQHFQIVFEPVNDAPYVIESDLAGPLDQGTTTSDPSDEAATSSFHATPVIRVSGVGAAVLFAVGVWTYAMYHVRLQAAGEPHDVDATNLIATAERLLLYVVNNLKDPALIETWPADLPRPEFDEAPLNSPVSLARVGTELGLAGAGFIMHHELSHIRNGHRGSAVNSIAQEQDADAEAAQWILHGARTSGELWKRALGIAVAILAIYTMEQRWEERGRRTHPPALERLVAALDHASLNENDAAYAVAALGVAEIAGLAHPGGKPDRVAWRDWLSNVCVDALRKTQ